MPTRSFTTKKPYPAAVITLATPLSNRQEILFQTRYDVQGYNTILNELPDGTTNETINIEDCSTLEWAIKSLTVSLYRDWSTSRARIVLTCNLPNASAPIPSLPDVSPFRGGDYPFLTIDDEIRIYAGYIDSPTTPITTDLLDEVPFPLTDIQIDEEGNETIVPLEQVKQPSNGTSLVPIFWGFIDKIDYDGSSRASGHQVIISCRDRVRVMTDTTLISIPSLSGVFGNSDSKVLPNGALHQIVSDVARAVNGFQLNVPDSTLDESICWKRILTPRPKLGDLKTEAAQELDRASKLVELYTAYETANIGRVSTQGKRDTEDPSLFVRRASFKVMDYLSRPRFHMWLNRPPLAKEGGTANWQVLDRSPMSIIKWIAVKEERPLDFYASHVNGDFCLVPRVLDTSGFKDEFRNYRTYFFRDYPRLAGIEPPCPSQLVLNMRAFTNIIGTFNRITIVDNSDTSGAGLSVLDHVALTIDRIPFILDNRKVTPPCRLKLVYDGGLANYRNSYGAALIVAMATSAQVSRDVSGIEFTVLGDPTFYPGEAVRVYNTFLHDNNYITQSGRTVDTLSKQKEYDRLQQFYSSNPSAAATSVKGTTGIMQSVEADNEVVRNINRLGTIQTSKENLNLPVYKIRSIEHKITTQGKAAGYTTTVLGSLDLNN